MFELNAISVLFVEEILHALGEVVDLGLFQANPLSLLVIAFVVVTILSVLIHAEKISEAACTVTMVSSIV